MPFIEKRQSARLQSKENTKRGRFYLSSLEEDACSEETETVEAVKSQTRPITSKRCKRKLDYFETFNKRSRCSTETNKDKFTIKNESVVLSTQSVSSQLGRSLSESNSSQTKYPSSRLAYLCKSEPPVSSKRTNILGKCATLKQDNSMNSNYDIFLKGRASVVLERIDPLRLKVIDTKTPIIPPKH